MIASLKQWATQHGNRLQVIPVGRLQDIQGELAVLQENEDLNGFQKWIINGMYKFKLPAAEFDIRSIILMAIPHPFYANVEFAYHARHYNTLSLVRSDFDGAKKDLNDFLAAHNDHILPAVNLPLKRLAVQSGLAVYGRNNICFVEGMGSSFSFAGYFSDAACEQDDWMEVRQAELCSHCQACANNCPTGAIRKDRFLINNEICLSNLNESPGEFPEWLPKSVHHCLYDCLKCQIICPMNKAYVKNIIGPIKFSEEETELLLSGSPLDAFTPELKQKAKYLGMDEWIGSIPRNMKALFELSDHPI
jgi:epoxyqueuosine reductase